MTVVNVRDYACAKVMRLLDSYLAGELSVETNHEILEHLARCLKCPGELAAREKLRASVRRVSVRLANDPPDGFEDRVRTLLGRTPPPRRVPAPAALMAAAVLCGAAGLAVVTWRGLRHPTADTAFDAGALPAAARTQTNCALAGAWRTKPVAPLAEMQASLGPPYAAALASLAEKAPGYRILAAHRCAHGGREVVHVVLAREGDPTPAGIVSAIVMPRRGPLPRARLVAADHLAWDGGGTLALEAARQDGFDIAAVELPDADLFVVSSRGAKESVALSRVILPSLVTAAVAR
jgi:anti-sigma factor RsiW